MDIDSLHNQAMDLAQDAMVARRRGNPAKAGDLLCQALEKEQHAALLALSEGEPEPSRSILLKSAAYLAIECGEQRAAERLISHALAGNPPPEIADELRSLLHATGPKLASRRRSQRTTKKMAKNIAD